MVVSGYCFVGRSQPISPRISAKIRLSRLAEQLIFQWLWRPAMICHVGSEQSSEVQPILQRLCSEPLTNDDDIVFNKTMNKYHGKIWDR